ncbi:MAG TPA: hypothetical protein VGA70_04230 [Longimicrobiales bacterium]
MSAFAAVFVLLSFLAVVMRALVALFPAEVAAGTDAAMIAAVTSAVSVAYPGTKVTKIEEIQ